ncbi:hypothetical protein [Streptomyces uncialis]|uniref:hypothetical protein n=1 Tax=Streptomyces uncialis TaxID=1048205 RepID=UPI00225443E1|nr:hypothetical protein [Streptomyces uncialis]MCX4663351.1 hypothetical protein [Streptomyces uncialis]
MSDDPTTGTGTGIEGDQGGNGATGDQGDPQTDPTNGGITAEGDQGEGDASAELVTERTARAAAEKRAETAEQEAARLRRSNAAQKPGDLDALRDEIRAEFTGQLVRAEIRAAAAGRLRDPGDALSLLDVSALAGSGGDVDAGAVAVAVAELVKAKPYLAAESGTSSGTAPAPWGDVGSGPRSDSAETEPAAGFDRLRNAYKTD